MKLNRAVAVLVPLLLVVAGCQSSKSSNPLSPTVAGPIPGVAISAPKLLEPAPGWQVDSTKQPLTLLLENSASSGQRPVSYEFQVATDAAFSNLVFTRDSIAQGDGGRTSVRLPDPLAGGRTYYWRARGADGANTGDYSSAANFDVFVPIVINEPLAAAPAKTVTITQTKPTFTIGNSSTSGPVGAISYRLELAKDVGFSQLVAIWNVAQQPDHTTFEAPVDLGYSTVYFWHVRGLDQTTTGPWSATESFKTPDAPKPVPTPTPGGGGGSCASLKSPNAIVQCRRAQWGHMSSGDIVNFLSSTARDLNAAAVGGNPFGILKKSTGNNCNGFSCDIICNGGGQGWDVLSDSEGAQTANWGDPIPISGASCVIQ